MRKVIDLQMEFWKKDIAHIEFDLQSRDEIPKLLMGLQYIYSTPEIREKVFKVLNRIVPKKSHETGRSPAFRSRHGQKSENCRTGIQ